MSIGRVEAYVCGHCGTEEDVIFACGRCGDAHYCGAPCQRAAWKLHKKVCFTPLSSDAAKVRSPQQTQLPSRNAQQNPQDGVNSIVPSEEGDPIDSKEEKDASRLAKKAAEEFAHQLLMEGKRIEESAKKEYKRREHDARREHAEKVREEEKEKERRRAEELAEKARVDEECRRQRLAEKRLEEEKAEERRKQEEVERKAVLAREVAAKIEREKEAEARRLEDAKRKTEQEECEKEQLENFSCGLQQGATRIWRTPYEEEQEERDRLSCGRRATSLQSRTLESRVHGPARSSSMGRKKVSWAPEVEVLELDKSGQQDGAKSQPKDSMRSRMSWTRHKVPVSPLGNEDDEGSWEEDMTVGGSSSSSSSRLVFDHGDAEKPQDKGFLLRYRSFGERPPVRLVMAQFYEGTNAQTDGFGHREQSLLWCQERLGRLLERRRALLQAKFDAEKDLDDCSDTDESELEGRCQKHDRGVSYQFTEVSQVQSAPLAAGATPEGSSICEEPPSNKHRPDESNFEVGKMSAKERLNAIIKRRNVALAEREAREKKEREDREDGISHAGSDREECDAVKPEETLVVGLRDACNESDSDMRPPSPKPEDRGKHFYIGSPRSHGLVDSWEEYEDEEAAQTPLAQSQVVQHEESKKEEKRPVMLDQGAVVKNEGKSEAPLSAKDKIKALLQQKMAAKKQHAEEVADGGVSAPADISCGARKLVEDGMRSANLNCESSEARRSLDAPATVTPVNSEKKSCFASMFKQQLSSSESQRQVVQTPEDLERAAVARRTLDLLEARRLVELTNDSRGKRKRSRSNPEKRYGVDAISRKMEEEYAAAQSGPRFLNDKAVETTVKKKKEADGAEDKKANKAKARKD